MNRRSFLVGLGAGMVATAAGATMAAEFLVAPVGASGEAQGAELVVNGSFELGGPGADLPGWTVLV